MVKIERSIEIDAPVEEVFAFFSDPNNLPEIWPSMVEVSNVKRGTNGPRSFEWVYKMAGIRFKGRSETLEWKQNEKVVSRNKKGIPSTLTYRYEDLGSRTRVSVEAEYEIPNKVLRKLAEPIVRRINEHEAGVLLNNLKARMELSTRPPKGGGERPTARA